MSYLTPRSSGPVRADVLLTLAEVAGIGRAWLAFSERRSQ
jgi:hypothetical protein